MLRLTLAQMRRSTVRLLAAGLAIAIGTAFIAATLLGSAIMRDTTYDAMTAEVAGADVVVAGAEAPFSPGDLADVRALPGVSVADGEAGLFTSFAAGAREDWAPVHTVPSPGLERTELLEGELPTATGQVAVTAGTAERLEVGLGDIVATEAEVMRPDATDEDRFAMVADKLVVTGILADPSPLSGFGSLALVSETQRDAWTAEADTPTAFHTLLVNTADGVSADDVADTVAEMFPDALVQTGEQYAQQRTAELTGSTYLFTALILAFGALAMFVAAIVITNTFQVLVAQRTHTLALLRAVGATTGQVRRSVLLEALLLGTVSGVVGLTLGVGLAQVALWVLPDQELGVPLPETVTVTPAVVLVPVVTGALVTWLAALAPARAATRVSPLAALRPPQPPDPRGASRTRVVLSVLLLAVGAVLIGGAVVLGGSDVSPDTAILGGLALGVLGGFVSFAGVMLGVVFIAPGVVRVLGRLTARLGGGTTVRITTANATRNPRRTAATATALVIGVTLVTLMSTGAVSARASLDALLRAQFPVDMLVESTAWDAETGQMLDLTPAQVATVRETEGVAEVAEVSRLFLPLSDGGPSDMVLEIPVVAVDPDAVAGVLHDDRILGGLTATTVVAGPMWASDMGVEEGDVLTLEDVEVTVVLADVGREAYVSTELSRRLVSDPPVSQLWARLTDSSSAQTITDVQDRLTELGATGTDAPEASTPFVTGPAAERAMYEQVINTLLAIVVGLLGVAVVIALIGVANTLSLSVIERRRESALLRAMGLTRRQLRAMLGIEGVLLALTGVLIGIVLGLLYGWAGTAVLLGQTDELTIAVPWLHIAAIVLVAVLAGLAASVLPARSAVRTPPVAALATE
ncbi:MAG TPA: FtsX-like permease family protein [Actinomycetaceae bacterium]|nr:FtsX-like permease family protein [Actinomycetaceae bacterium]